MTPVNLKWNSYIDSSKEIIKINSKFKIGGTVRILKYKNVFAKGYTPTWSEEVFVIKKVKHGSLGIKKLLERSRKRIAENKSKIMKIEKVIKRKGDKLCVKWKGYDNSFNSWIDKKYTV